MRGRLRQFYAIASLTTLEAARQPVCLLLMLTCLILTGLLPFVIMNQFGEQGRLVRDSALSCHLVFGLFVGGLAACSAISRETIRGTATTVISKPVPRGLFFLAKYTGICGVLAVFSLCATLATLMSERAAPRQFMPDWFVGGLLLLAPFLTCALAGINTFFSRRHFVSHAFCLLPVVLAALFLIAGLLGGQDRPAGFGAAFAWRLVPANLLIAMAIAVLAAIAAALSTRLNTVPTLALCTALFLLGLLAEHLFGRHAAQFGPAACLYALTPNLQHFWLADALTDGKRIPWHYVGGAARYAALYAAGVLCLGAVSFQYREIS